MRVKLGCYGWKVRVLAEYMGAIMHDAAEVIRGTEGIKILLTLDAEVVLFACEINSNKYQTKCLNNIKTFTISRNIKQSILYIQG